MLKILFITVSLKHGFIHYLMFQKDICRRWKYQRHVYVYLQLHLLEPPHPPLSVQLAKLLHKCMLGKPLGAAEQHDEWECVLWCCPHLQYTQIISDGN